MKTVRLYLIALNLLVAIWCLGCFIATLDPINLILFFGNLICAAFNYGYYKQ